MSQKACVWNLEKMKIKCDSCQKHFVATPAQVRQIEQAQKKRKRILLLKCAVCGCGFIFQHKPPVQSAEQKPALLLRCPVAGCAGFVTEVQEKKKTLLSCGECGSIWHSQSKLFAAISDIVHRFPYRRKCYRKQKAVWLPTSAAREPQDYEELVEREGESRNAGQARRSARD
jgi:hypothetical protein